MSAVVVGCFSGVAFCCLCFAIPYGQSIFFTASAHQRLNCKRIKFTTLNCEMITNFINCYTHKAAEKKKSAQIHTSAPGSSLNASAEKSWPNEKWKKKMRPAWVAVRSQLSEFILCKLKWSYTSHRSGQGFKIMRMRDEKGKYCVHTTTVQWRVHLHSDSIFIGVVGVAVVVAVCIFSFRVVNTIYVLLCVQILMFQQRRRRAQIETIAWEDEKWVCTEWMNDQKSTQNVKNEKPKCPSGTVCYVNIETLTHFVVSYEYESAHYTHTHTPAIEKPLMSAQRDAHDAVVFLSNIA